MALTVFSCVVGVFFLVCFLPAAGQVQVWRQMEDPTGLVQRYQQRGNQISKLAAGVVTSVQIVLPNDAACIVYRQSTRQLVLQNSAGPRPCSSSFLDAAVAQLGSHPFGAPGEWYLTGTLNGTLNCCTPGAYEPVCNASTAATFVVANGNCGSLDWAQYAYNPPWALRAAQSGGRTGFITAWQTGLQVVLLGGKNASTGQPLYDTWVECKRDRCSTDVWLQASDLPAGCNPVDLSSFTLGYHVYVVCPTSPGALEFYGLDSDTLQWAAVQLTLPPAPALPPSRYQDTKFATLSYTEPQAPPPSLQRLRATAGAEPLSPQGGCLIALTGGPNVVPAMGNTSLAVTNDGRTWRSFATPLLSRTNAAVVPFQSSVQGYGLGILGGVGASGQYLPDSWILDGQLCCATSCDPTGINCVICSGHGSCVANGNTVCVCDSGWSGDFCTQGLPTQTATATATSTATVGSSQSSTATATTSATATATVGTSASSTASASASRGSSASPSSVPSAVPVPPSQPASGIVPGLDGPGGLSVVVVCSLLGAALVMTVAWKAIARMRAVPSVLPSQLAVPAWQ